MKFALALVGFCVLLGMGGGPAYAGRSSSMSSAPGAPVDVEVTPGVVAAGGTVAIHGTTYVDNKRFTVTITVEPPKGGGKPVVYKAKVNPKTGAFKQTHRSGPEPGAYRVTVVAPDGKGKGNARFRALTGSDFGNEAAKSLTAAVALAKKGLSATNEAAKTLPPSPAVEQLKVKLSAVRSKLAAWDKPIQSFAKGLGAAAEAAYASPDVARAAEPDLKELGTWLADAGRDIASARERLKAASGKPSDCDRIDMAGEAVGALSLLLTLTGRGVDIVARLIAGGLIPKAISTIPPKDPGAERAKFAWTQANKLLPPAVESLEELKKATGGMATDLGQFFTKELFSAYCVRYEGPVTAKFAAGFDHAGSPFWKYSVNLEGWLTLRFPKNAAAGKPIRLTGQIEGNATQFRFDEDIFAVEKPPKGMLVIRRQKIKPIPFFNSTKNPLGLGLFARMGTPAYFYIPVEGELVGGTIVFKLLDAKVDFSSAVKNRLVLIAVNPALPIPMVRTFSFPIQKAQFILSRGMHPAPEFKITVSGKKSVIQRTFTRDWTSSSGEIRVKWVVNVRAESG